jgi:hypothetical protein
MYASGGYLIFVTTIDSFFPDFLEAKGVDEKLLDCQKGICM